MILKICDNMKQKLLQISLIVLSILAVTNFSSCRKTTLEDKARVTVERFINCLKHNKQDSIAMIYPNCSFAKAINIGQVSILDVKPWGNQGLYVVTCNNSHSDETGALVNSSVRFTIQTKMYEDKDIQNIQDSQGLIELPTELRSFLNKTGALRESVNDADIAKEYSAYIDFVNLMMQNTQLDLKTLADQTYSGDEYNLYLANFPHANASVRLSPVN